MKRTLLSLMLLVASLASFAYDFEVDGFYYNVLSKDDLTCEVTYGTYGDNNYTGKVTIPSQVSYAGKVFNVTSIGSSAFYKCHSLTSVTIPNSVTSIGGYAFRHCSGLTSCHIGNSVTDIKYQAFAYCSSLCSINIPNSVTYIGQQAFYDCKGLTKAEFASIESLCKIVFYDEDSNPISYTHNLYIDGNEIKEVVIPNSVTSIGNCAFNYCSSLTSVTIPNSVTSIGYKAF